MIPPHRRPLFQFIFSYRTQIFLNGPLDQNTVSSLHGQFIFEIVYFSASPNFRKRQTLSWDTECLFPYKLKFDEGISKQNSGMVGGRRWGRGLSLWETGPLGGRGLETGAPGNSSVTESAVIHSSHQHANVLLLTGYVTLLPGVNAWECQFNLT